MSEQRKAISRQELYEKVWATPIVRLAQELGYSYPELIAIIAAQDSLALVHVLRGPDEIFPRIRAAARTRHDVVADKTHVGHGGLHRLPFFRPHYPKGDVR